MKSAFIALLGVGIGLAGATPVRAICDDAGGPGNQVVLGGGDFGQASPTFREFVGKNVASLTEYEDGNYHVKGRQVAYTNDYAYPMSVALAIHVDQGCRVEVFIDNYRVYYGDGGETVLGTYVLQPGQSVVLESHGTPAGGRIEMACFGQAPWQITATPAPQLLYANRSGAPSTQEWRVNVAEGGGELGLLVCKGADASPDTCTHLTLGAGPGQTLGIEVPDGGSIHAQSLGDVYGDRPPTEINADTGATIQFSERSAIAFATRG